MKELELHRFQRKTILDERNSKYKVLNKNIFFYVCTETNGARLERVRESKMAGSDRRGGNRRVRARSCRGPGQEKDVESV